MEPSTKFTTPPLDRASLPADLRPTVESPLVVHSPAKGSSAEFDPAPLIDLLGKPKLYESAVLVSIRQIDKPETIKTDWGDAHADPDTHVVATPWIINSSNQTVPVGKPYPLLKTELERREQIETQSPTGDTLFKKPGITEFWHVPKELVDKIHVFSPESAPNDPQIAREGKIIAFTKTGAWITNWDESKFREVVS